MTDATGSNFVAPAEVAPIKRSLPSSASIRSASLSKYRYACNTQCPNCGGRLIRTTRRPQDKILSLVTPLARFRCDRFSCQWAGNMQRHVAPGATNLSTWLEPGSPRRTMVFAFAGALALVLYLVSGPFA